MIATVAKLKAHLAKVEVALEEADRKFEAYEVSLPPYELGASRP